MLGKKSVHKWELMMLVPGKKLDRKQGPVLMVPDKRSAGSLGQRKCLAMAQLFLQRFGYFQQMHSFVHNYYPDYLVMDSDNFNFDNFVPDFDILPDYCYRRLH